MTDPQKTAPGDLEVVRQFINTLDLEAGQDALASASATVGWLRSRGLLSGGSHGGVGAFARAIVVREALRELARVNAGDLGTVPEAARTLDAAARRAGVAIHFAADGSSRLEPEATGIDGAMGLLLVRVAASMADGTWSRFKACRDDRCRWAFYDNTKNRSGVWCDMAVCGNRNKARSYRHRHGS